jgi:GDPmannose 4,6-dehydratase
MKKALITGITGQDGSYLAEFLLEKGYEVHGIIRRASSFNTGRLENIFQYPHEENLRLFLYYGDLTDSTNIISIIKKIEPDEIYNLGAQSHVKVSFETPEYTAQSDALGVLRILEAVRLLNLDKKIKIYQASTSELYGKAVEIPQNEKTPFYPRSPYGVAKLYAFWIAKNYREAYNMFICNGILFNHESPRRGRTFVTRKVINSLCKIKYGMEECLYIGNLEAKRDWGYAKEYVESMWLMLQQEEPEDYVIATGESHSVRELIEETCKHLMIDIEWRGEGINEEGIDKGTGKVIIKIDSNYFRPTEVDYLIGDASKAKEKLGWEAKTKFHDLVKLMVDFEISKVRGIIQNFKND